MTFWREGWLSGDDAINGEIWERSPAVQRSIHPPAQLLPPGSVGAQQAMLPGNPSAILPWAPDVLGSEWNESASVTIIGSAYAGFIRECSTRRNTLPVDSYIDSQNWQEFASQFRDCVIEGDRSYYEPLAQLVRLATGHNDARGVALLDVCRASFVRRDAEGPSRRDESGDRVVLAAPATFERYAEHDASHRWTWDRLISGQARRVIALGTIAEHGLLRLFARAGCRIHQSISGAECRLRPYPLGCWVRRYASTGSTLGGWLASGGCWVVTHDGLAREWRVLPVAHPARSLAGGGYAQAAEVVKRM